MRVMVIVKATKNSEAGVMPSEQLLTAMGKYNEELASAGILQSGEGLQPSSHGKRIAISSKGRAVSDGPFEATTELAAGFWIWKVSSIDDAVDWARRCPEPMPGEETTLELRPLFEMEDFGDEMTPELREKEGRLRVKLEDKEMSASRIDHDTILLEHRYAASPRAVFAAWADPTARVQWSVSPNSEAMEYLESDFQVGGRDVSRCGPHGNLRFRVDAQYRDIDPDRRIVFVETVATGDTTISIALVTLEIEPDHKGSHVTLTVQIVSLVGRDGIAGSASGYRGALKRLATHLIENKSAVNDAST